MCSQRQRSLDNDWTTCSMAVSRERSCFRSHLAQPALKQCSSWETAGSISPATMMWRATWNTSSLFRKQYEASWTNSHRTTRHKILSLDRWPDYRFVSVFKWSSLWAASVQKVVLGPVELIRVWKQLRGIESTTFTTPAWCSTSWATKQCGGE